MSSANLAETIMQFFRDRGKEIPDEKCDLFENQIIDSMELIELIMFLEQELGLEIDQEFMAADNFRSVAAMLDTIGKDRD